MQPIAIAIAVALVLIVALADSNPKPQQGPKKAPAYPPGPGAQGAGRNIPAGRLPDNMRQPQNEQSTSPNSTLTTINNGMVVTNQALGMFGLLPDYIGSNSDSEYPVPGSMPSGMGSTPSEMMNMPPSNDIGSMMGTSSDSTYW